MFSELLTMFAAIFVCGSALGLVAFTAYYLASGGKK
jgi:hypothetical protein